jgi:ATP-binding cassette subfamily A (ABC1) protein 3
MLTGLYEPTAGDATLYGRKISTDMQAVRKFIGVCPQHDVLFSSLTCREHLKIFGQLKFPDASEDELEAQIESLLAQVGLSEKSSTQAVALSGGMKRKLSLLISLIGDCRVLFLDEPTSGMDPFSRRSTWRFLRGNRSGRCIVLTGADPPPGHCLISFHKILMVQFGGHPP